jgi:hypothetical protein
MSNSRPALREQLWYAVVWGALYVISGLWTVFCILIAFLLVFIQPPRMEAGLAPLAWEILLVLSIPIYCLFVGLLCFRPKAVKIKTKKEDVRYDY